MSVEPKATYRIQLNPQFTFDDATDIVDYLAALGISHLYCSPYLQAAPGSMHGYDVVDHSRLNEDLGGVEAHQRLCRALNNSGMSQLLDIVPNHMAITGPENPWWWDVLENGPSSWYASYFDVDWEPPEARRRNKVLLPVLGDHYGRVLEAGEFTLRHNQGMFTLHYYDQVFPMAPRSLSQMLETAAKHCRSDELGFIAGAFSQLPLATATDRSSVQRRHRDKEVLQTQLRRLCDEQPNVAAAIDAVIAEFNSNPDALDELIEMQNYRVAFWHMAEHELGYRRFFNINTLVGLHMEDEQVFTDTHKLIRSLVKKGFIDGLRIDHTGGCGK